MVQLNHYFATLFVHNLGNFAQSRHKTVIVNSQLGRTGSAIGVYGGYLLHDKPGSTLDTPS
jgi:hypothetical protein